MKTHYVVLMIDGKEVPSSCICDGSYSECLSSIRRMMAAAGVTRNRFGIRKTITSTLKNE